MWRFTAVALGFEPDDLQDGDLVFQRSESPQSAAIAEATGSAWTHMGVVLREEGKILVLEAVEPVRLTPIDAWIAHGRGPAAAKRLDRALSTDEISAFHALAAKWRGRHYDAAFSWTDERLYCSELAWKLYERTTGVRLGEPRPLGSYRLDGREVRRKAEKRFPRGLPLDELVVSPQDVFDADGLVDLGTAVPVRRKGVRP